MIEYYLRTAESEELKKVNSFRQGCWINLTNPSENELKKLVSLFNLNRELLEEGTDNNELPRIDFDDNENVYFFVKTSFKNKLKTKTLLIVLGQNFFLTLSQELPEELKPILNNKTKIITTKKRESIVKILTLIDENMQKNVALIEKNVQAKKLSTKELKEKDLETLLDYEDFLNSLISTYNYTSIMYSKILKKIQLYEDNKEMLEDLIVETEQSMNQCKNALKTISNIRNNYSIILSNRLTRTLRFLTIFTILLSIPSTIGALYGMNIMLPFMNNPFAFYYICALIITIIGIFLAYLKIKKIF